MGVPRRILDLALPRLDGLDLCRLLRAKGSQVPILMLADAASS
ncbi:hypothetical protein [Roseateles sp.]